MNRAVIGTAVFLAIGAAGFVSQYLLVLRIAQPPPKLEWKPKST